MSYKNIKPTAASFGSIKLVVTLVIAIVAIYVLSPILKALNLTGGALGDKVEEAIEQAKANGVEAKWSTYSAADHKELKRKAESIHKAFHDSWDEDEDTAVRELNSIKTATQVKVVSDYYRAIYGASLKTEAAKYLSDGWQVIATMAGTQGTDMARVKAMVKENWY